MFRVVALLGVRTAVSEQLVPALPDALNPGPPSHAAISAACGSSKSAVRDAYVVRCQS